MIKTLNQIDTSTNEGKLLLMALAKITTEIHTDKTPDECIALLNDLANDTGQPQTSMLSVTVTILPVECGGFDGGILCPDKLVFFTDPKRPKTIPYADKVSSMVITYKEGNPAKGISADMRFNYPSGGLEEIKNIIGSVVQIVEKGNFHPERASDRYFVKNYKINK